MLNKRDLRAKARKCLGQLATNRPATEHKKALRLFAKLVEDRFIREKADPIEATDWWNGGACAGGDDEIFRAQFHLSDLHFPRREETRAAAKNVNTERFKTFL